jgi:hypothetical protein
MARQRVHAAHQDSAAGQVRSVPDSHRHPSFSLCAYNNACTVFAVLVCVQVSQRDGPRSFSGPSPTRPWTDVCLAFRTGQRISGDHTQKQLAYAYRS